MAAQQQQQQQQQQLIQEQQQLIEQQQQLLLKLQQQNQQASAAEAQVGRDIYGGRPRPLPPYPLPRGPIRPPASPGHFRPPPLVAFPPIPGVPEGLEPLAVTDSIHVQQQVEVLEIVFGVETENRYDVLNKYGQRIFFAGEKSDHCDRQYLKQNRPFVLYLFDSQGRVAVTMERACNFQLRCWGSRCAGTVLTIKSGFTGELYGTVSQKWNCCTPHFNILDHEGNKILEIVGPSNGSCCICSCVMRGDAEFSVLDRNQAKGQERTRVGTIMKVFSLLELIPDSDANTFGIRFNQDLDPRTKAVLLGATFAIDFAFFEEGSGFFKTGAILSLDWTNSRCACSICCVIIVLIQIIVCALSIRPIVAYFNNQEAANKTNTTTTTTINSVG